MPEPDIPTRHPDPTQRTIEQLHWVIATERDYVIAQLDVIRERFAGIDRATNLLSETVNKVPTDVQLRVGHMHDLHDADIKALRELSAARLAEVAQEFRAVEQQFRERDIRSEREARDNKVAVDAAFAAQKEAAAKQNEGNQSAIDKSEAATKETIKTNAELFRSATEALKESVTRMELQITSLQSSRQGGRETISGIYAFLGVILTLLLIGGTLITILANKP